MYKQYCTATILTFQNVNNLTFKFDKFGHYFAKQTNLQEILSMPNMYLKDSAGKNKNIFEWTKWRGSQNGPLNHTLHFHVAVML